MMRFVQIACCVASVTVLALSIWNLTCSELTGAPIILGLLCSSRVPLLFIGIGLLPSMVTATEDSQTE